MSGALGITEAAEDIIRPNFDAWSIQDSTIRQAPFVPSPSSVRGCVKYPVRQNLLHLSSCRCPIQRHRLVRRKRSKVRALVLMLPVRQARKSQNTNRSLPRTTSDVYLLHQIAKKKIQEMTRTTRRGTERCKRLWRWEETSMHLQIPYKIQLRKKLSKKKERPMYRKHLPHQRVHVAQRLPLHTHRSYELHQPMHGSYRRHTGGISRHENLDGIFYVAHRRSEYRRLSARWTRQSCHDSLGSQMIKRQTHKTQHYQCAQDTHNVPWHCNWILSAKTCM